MDDIMKERRQLLIYIIISAVGFTAMVLVGAVFFVNKTVINPLNTLTMEMRRLKPAENVSYEEAGVVLLDIKSRDEINDIYRSIRSMQMNLR